MARMQIIESLFALLPIVLVVIATIVLRTRSVRRRAGREQAAGPSPKRQRTPAAGPRTVWERGGGRQGAEPRSEGAPERPLRPAPSGPAAVGFREGYAYPPPILRDMAKTRSAEPRREASLDRRRLVGPAPPMPSLGASPTSPARRRPSVSGRAQLARLVRLPPLKRAVIWAEILGPPGGRQQPHWP